MKRLDSAVSTQTQHHARSAARALTHDPATVLSARWLASLVLLTLLCFWVWPAHAQDTDAPARVGRLADVQGKVWLYDIEASEWIEAGRNRPITTGDRISTERGARAEVRVGSTILRIDGNTEIEITRLDDDHLNVQLHSGSLATRLRTREAAREFELTTEEGRFEAPRAGNYRFDRDDDTTEATVVNGQLQFLSQDSGVTVNAGQRAEFWRENGTQHQFTDPARDDFTDWVASADSREERSVSAKYVSAEMTGVEELDRHGRWQQDAEYGPLWTPVSVSANWAPYRTGHWTWIHPWGWTWVDDAPWGFAPFHYGRWVQVRNVWCWSPGRYVARPVYAPALVAWVGGPGVSVSVRLGGGPTVGWFPLAPREVYVPSYRYSPGYLRHVNHPSVRDITSINTIIANPGRARDHISYRNRGLPHAITVVPSTVLERRQPVGPAIIGVRTPLRQETYQQPPNIAAPRPRTDRPAPGQAFVVPPAPGRQVFGGARDRDGRNQRDPRESFNRPGEVRRPDRDRNDRDTRPGIRPDQRENPSPVRENFSRDRNPPGVTVNPQPGARPQPSIPQPMNPQPAPQQNGRDDNRFNRPPVGSSEDNRFGRPPVGNDDNRWGRPPAGGNDDNRVGRPRPDQNGTGNDTRFGRPPVNNNDGGDRGRPQRDGFAERIPAPVANPAPVQPPLPVQRVSPPQPNPGGGADERFRRERRQEIVQPAERPAERPPTVFAPPPRPVQQPVAPQPPQPPQVVRPPVVQQPPPPQMQPPPQVQQPRPTPPQREERRGNDERRGNEGRPGGDRFDGPRNRQLN